jgi:two-component system, sensor histidine kinase PdtaS
MAELSGQEREGGALDKVWRHIRILVDIGRLAGENGDLDRFLSKRTSLEVLNG